MPYPLYGGYSDFIILDKKSIHDFAHYCGVFAAMNVFVEIAIPTAMKVCCSNVKTVDKVPYKAGILREKERIEFEKKYDLDFKRLVVDWPD